MKKMLSLSMILVLLSLCACNGEQENTATRFLLDTVVTLTADCDDETLDGAFSLCSDYEKLFSRTITESDVYKLNNTSGFVQVSDETVSVIKKAIYYSEVTNGAFDITICPVSELWNFNEEIVPSRNEIAEALKNVDYNSIEIDGSRVNLNGKKIDLGSIAKGYIADSLIEYFEKNNVKSGIINLGGNVVVFGDKQYNVGIQKPFSDDIIGNISINNKSAVTSGIYQRYIEKDGKIYHHILDTTSGYGVQNGLAAVTIINDCSVDGDALSTVCMLLGEEKSKSLIEGLDNTEAIFIDTNGNISYTSGLYREDKLFLFK